MISCISNTELNTIFLYLILQSAGAKLYLPKIFILSGKVISFKFLQLKNAQSSIIFTLFGIWISSIPLEAKADARIISKFSGSTILLILLSEQNALLPISFIYGGKTSTP